MSILEQPKIFDIKQGDLEPDIAMHLVDRSKNYYDLSTAQSVTFRMARSIDFLQVVSAPMTIISAASGLVSYSWQAGDTDEYGQYYAEVRVIDENGEPITFPSDDHIIVMIERSLT